jgi:DNA-binding transcriptional regulator YiaG
MPRGYPKASGLGPSDSTKRIEDTIRDLEEQLAAARAKDRARALLLTFAQKHELSAVDLRNAAKLLAARKVGDAPVVSLVQRKSTLRPDKAKPAKGKVGKAIRAGRIKASLTDRSLATQLGCHVSVVNRWQRGGEVAEHFRPRLIELLKLPKSTFPPLGNGAAHD